MQQAIAQFIGTEHVPVSGRSLQRSLGAVSEPIELVIFDCDGVLVDSERIAVRVMASVFERLGRPMAEAEIIERYVGLSGTYAADIRAYERNGSQRSWEEESELLYHERSSAS